MVGRARTTSSNAGSADGAYIALLRGRQAAAARLGRFLPTCGDPNGRTTGPVFVAEAAAPGRLSGRGGARRGAGRRADPMRRPYPIVGSPWWAVDLPNGLIAVFDSESAALFEGRSPTYRQPPPGRAAWTGYIRLIKSRDGSTVGYLHRLVLNAAEGEIVDHINHDGLDCRASNLRLASPSQSVANRRVQSNNRSGFKGVKRAKGSKWCARIGRCENIGSFSTAEEAARAYDQAAFERYGSFACLNFPDDASAPSARRTELMHDDESPLAKAVSSVVSDCSLHASTLRRGSCRCPGQRLSDVFGPNSIGHRAR